MGVSREVIEKLKAQLQLFVEESKKISSLAAHEAYQTYSSSALQEQKEFSSLKGMPAIKALALLLKEFVKSVTTKEKNKEQDQKQDQEKDPDKIQDNYAEILNKMSLSEQEEADLAFHIRKFLRIMGPTELWSWSLVNIHIALEEKPPSPEDKANLSPLEIKPLKIIHDLEQDIADLEKEHELLLKNSDNDNALNYVNSQIKAKENEKENVRLKAYNSSLLSSLQAENTALSMFDLLQKIFKTSPFEVRYLDDRSIQQINAIYAAVNDLSTNIDFRSDLLTGLNRLKNNTSNQISKKALFTNDFSSEDYQAAKSCLLRKNNGIEPNYSNWNRLGRFVRQNKWKIGLAILAGIAIGVGGPIGFGLVTGIGALGLGVASLGMGAASGGLLGLLVGCWNGIKARVTEAIENREETDTLTVESYLTTPDEQQLNIPNSSTKNIGKTVNITPAKNEEEIFQNLEKQILPEDIFEDVPLTKRKRRRLPFNASASYHPEERKTSKGVLRDDRCQVGWNAKKDSSKPSTP